MKKRVGILGGGTAGSTIAIRLAALGLETFIFEKNASLINGPPMCHLHAGGNLYREIPDQDCINLLQQSIDILRLYPFSIDARPTVFAVPIRDNNSPLDLIPRLNKLTNAYRELIDKDHNNKVLGEPSEYYKLYDKKQLLELSKKQPAAHPSTLDEWLIPAAKYMDLNKLQFPVIAVKEYGWNIFRLSASAHFALEQYKNAHVFINTNVKQVLNNNLQQNKWLIEYQQDTKQNTETIEVDYLINACGFRTGEIDDMVGVEVNRMVEFKSSYITSWQSNEGLLPEIVIYGERGTPQGMAQLTPYPNGYFQIHGMTESITLFNDGLVDSNKHTSQPKLPKKYINYIENGWESESLISRSQQAINHVSEFMPRFNNAKTVNNALYGGQQIPGNDETLRVTNVQIYPEINYARAENVKASSTLNAADEIVYSLQTNLFIAIDASDEENRFHHNWKYLKQVKQSTIDKKAQQLALDRGFPVNMGLVNCNLNELTLSKS
ncbi:FAD-dependent oxidoreductase [Pseudoalteromonas sp. MMG010]|uniref:FAD-dependent oxidoreductase n=1 Tax=Pseudoalteromonas sp. MMG010 TaxID=2822685 RepID=UPI001FFD3EA3|nr:FAD-dependent oxidoreductase [Pseudoalteromonas sp. MMG010]